MQRTDKNIHDLVVPDVILRELGEFEVPVALPLGSAPGYLRGSPLSAAETCPRDMHQTADEAATRGGGG